MSRLLLLIILIIGAFFLVRRFKRQWMGDDTAKREAPLASMVRCDHCKVFVPRQDSIELQGKHYCSKDHLREALTKQ